ncbi:MAG: SMC family ATPase, partial [Bacteroidetes bacterium]|nr:SMC family ATPase [Bacteroidota bacterium]
DNAKQLDENQKLQQLRLSLSGFIAMAEVRQVLMLKLDVENEKSAIEAYNKQLLEAGNEVSRLEKETAGKVFKEAEFNLLQEEVKQLKEEQLRVSQMIGSLKTSIELLKKNFEKRKLLLEKREVLQKKLDNLKIITNLFQGGKFVDYVSTIHLRNLCNTANDRFFKMTGQKMSLELNDSNEFMIRDYLNGGKTRSTRTLSGGQTFQASLSLALALSQGIQSQAKTGKGFFFIDEGFGSLDKDSLNVVFDTLKSLNKENRIVGVISHVEELQQEMNVFLKIENSDKTGSLIKESWNI